MTLRVAITSLGRIGRSILKPALDDLALELVAAKDLVGVPPKSDLVDLGAWLRRPTYHFTILPPTENAVPQKYPQRNQLKHTRNGIVSGIGGNTRPGCANTVT